MDNSTKSRKDGNSSSGYTEAERLALLWKKEQVKEQKMQSRRLQEEDRHREHDRNRREDTIEFSTIGAEEVDEFGRIKTKSTYHSAHYHREELYRPRSRDRRRSRSRSRAKERRYTSRSRSRSKSRHHSRSRSPPNDHRLNRRERDSGGGGAWGHDLYDEKEEIAIAEERKREVFRDYRPPSPEWISRAGGVAIMRKKSSTAATSSSTVSESNPFNFPIRNHHQNADYDRR